MSITDKAKDFFSDLLDEKEQQEILDTTFEEAEKPEPHKVDYVVYFKGDNPDCVWEYHHNPEDGIPTLDDDGKQVVDEYGVPQHDPYGRQYGYWSDPNEQGTREFVEHKSNNLKLMSFDTFMDRIPPNRDCTKIYESEAEFLLELI